MGDSTSQGSAASNGEEKPNSEKKLFVASKSDDGFWRDSDGVALPVSASDLERHAYCPLSWQLALSGVKGEGDAIELGKRRHKEIEAAMRDYQTQDNKARRAMVIWTWWFAIVVALAIDTAAFFFVEEGVIANEDFSRFSRYLALLALVWLIVAILLLFIPWRKLLGYPFGLAQPPAPTDFDIQDLELYYFEKEMTERGGWMEGGRVEFFILLGSLTLALHSFALFEAQERTIATFVLLVATLTWTLVATWQLHKGLSAQIEAEKKSEKLGIEKGTIITYNDDSESSGLLKDEMCGLRGRPDQIVVIENEVVPVEQKTGKVPEEPHFSHRLQVYAYLHLVGSITNKDPTYGILRYGDDALHQISWSEVERQKLFENVIEIQRLMVEGGASRNHNRQGKCKHCSRRHRCPEKLN